MVSSLPKKICGCAARDDAKLIVSTDPELKSPRGEALRVLLYLFERDEAVRLLRAG
jgi:ATP-dependent DNA helicase RecG